ncbi:unnamed protein product [Rhizophagus irregularis]|nr:unnamed protein product [Rhizophagus irregularis]CAB4443429.1 unnamed protein product [Rhizophagus irregularis]
MLEMFGILVDRRDFAFYAMNYYDGAYLDDGIFHLLSFRARVEYLNTRIIELLRDATSRRHSRHTTTAVDADRKSSIKK